MNKVAVDVEEDGAVKLLVNDVGLEDLIVERLRCSLGGRHFGCATQTPHWNKTKAGKLNTDQE